MTNHMNIMHILYHLNVVCLQNVLCTSKIHVVP